MQEPTRANETWILLVALATLVTGGGLYFSKPYESSRPTATDDDRRATTAPAAIPARLWQDPFTAVADWIPADADAGTPPPVSKAPSIEEGLIIMPVMVRGGFHSENTEKRLRRRYAVLSAMFAQNYRASHSETIGHIELTLDAPSRLSVPYEWLEPNLDRYATSAPRPPVLLLWLDERQFGTKPLQRLSGIIPKIVQGAGVPTPGTLDVRLLGPGSSGMLKRMLDEVIALIDDHALDPASWKIADSGLVPPPYSIHKGWKLSIYSPFATASAKLIVGRNEGRLRKVLGYNEGHCEQIVLCRNRYDDKKFTSLFLIEEAFSRVGIPFFRTISSDKRLLATVVEQEFAYRNIDPTDPEDVVVLVSEWDTVYSRSLPEAFIKEVRDVAGDATPAYENSRCDGNICNYVYFRGLDGENLASNPPEDEAAEIGETGEFERAVGPSRFDYLRRLAQAIEDDISRDSRTVRAVGVLGSDVYDKLLILQALKPNFSDALFFTTDADARVLHPAEADWARGLLVISGYGLSLDRQRLAALPCIATGDFDTQRDLPPFRDSYQTAVFLAAQLALAVDACESKTETQCVTVENCRRLFRAWLAQVTEPSAFEVGRSNFVSLDWGAGSQSHLPTLLAAFSIFAIALLLVCMYAFLTRSWSWRGPALVALALLVPAVPVGVAYQLDGADGEPMPLLNGSNILPTLYLLYLAVVLALFLMARAYRGLGRNARELVRRFQISDGERLRRYLSERKAYMHVPYLRHVAQPYVGMAGLHVAVAVLLIVGFGVAANPHVRGPASLTVYIVGVLLVLIGLFLHTYLIADETRRCLSMARRLFREGRWKRARSLQAYVRSQNCDILVSKTTGDALYRWRAVHLLAERTAEIEKVVYYPFTIALLLVVSHNWFFDNWRAFSPKALVPATGFLITVGCILWLRSHVEARRKDAVDSLKRAKAADAVNAVKWDRLIEDARNERRGAFRPLSADPILRAPLVPLGGYGSLYLIEIVKQSL